MTVTNHLENLDLYLEHDEGYERHALTPEELELNYDPKFVFNRTSEGLLKGCHYLVVDSNYVGVLSPGQQRLYEILVSLQDGAVYSVTTARTLADAMGIKYNGVVLTRLSHLQSLGAVSGFNVNRL